MEFVKKMKRKSIRNSVWLALLPFVFGVLSLWGSDIGWLFQKPQELWEVPEEELEGAYVTVELPFLYGAYAYEEEYEDNRPTGKTVSMEYLIDANDVSYCGLYVSGSAMKKADALMEQCYAYAEGTGDVPEKTFTVTGVMKPMSRDSLRFYKEFLEYDDMSQEEQALFLPLYLDTTVGVNWVMVGIAGIALIAAVWIVAYAASGKYQKNLVEAANTLSGGSPEYILDQVSQLRQTDPVCKGLWVGNNLVFIDQGFRQFLYEKKDICWAYPETTRQKLYGVITVGKSHAVNLRTMDGKKYNFPMVSKKIPKTMEVLDSALPDCVTGYSEELEKLYDQNRGQFAQIAAAQRGAQQ